MKSLLRLENAALLVLCVTAYHLNGGNWWLFALLILAPDLSFIGYLAGRRVGAIVYNAAHSWIGAGLVLTGGVLLGHSLTISLGLIWASHIAFDRMLGYGLKHFSGFHDTHLGRIGKAAGGGE